MILAAPGLMHPAVASSSLPSLILNRETTAGNSLKPLSVVPHPAPNSAPLELIAPSEVIETSVFSLTSDTLKQAQAYQGGLVVKQVRGKVTLRQEVVQVGSRLTAGVEINTGNDSSVSLEIDDHGGLVEVSENTNLQIKNLAGSDSSEATVFFISKGQARFSIPSLQGTASDRSEETTSSRGGSEKRLLAQSSGVKTLADRGEALLLAQRKSSRNYPVRVETPAGIAGVRGTSFGVSVGPDGKTGISVIKGSVGAIAQDQEVIFTDGQYVVLSPGTSPTQPGVTPELAKLRIRSVVRTSPYTALVTGQVDPMDIVFINGKAIETDSQGKFKVAVALPPSHRLSFVVRGPTVRMRFYEVVAF
ncbi:FecR domain-containing protein [Coleofasciculus sp. LEGE 07081]|nr:FecR domain-containing protein [Coleofasciculus sp. LEGE 07081]